MSARPVATLNLSPVPQKELRKLRRQLVDRKIETVWTYARVSSDEQAKGFSPTTQRQECERHSARQGWVVKDHISDVPAEGGIVLSRRGIVGLVHKLRKLPPNQRPHAILVRSVDRLARATVEGGLLVAELLRLQVVIRSVDQRSIDETPDGWATLEGLLSDAERDNSNRAQGSHRGMVAADEAGFWPRRAPFGYCESKIDAVTRKPSRVPEVDPVGARHVRDLFQRLAAGATRFDLFKEARAKGIGPRSREQFNKIFKNRFYIGVHPTNGTQGRWRPIITKELWQAVQDREAASRLAFEKPRWVRKEHPDYPLKRLLLCASCGGHPTPSAEGKSHKRKPYYKCSRCRIRWRRERTEAQFIELLGSIGILPQFAGDDWREELLTISKEYTSALKDRLIEARKSKDDLQAQYERAQDAFLGASATLRVDLEQRLRRLQGDRDAASEALRAISGKSQSVQRDLLALASSARDAGRNLPQLWKSSGHERRTLLQELIFPHGIVVERSGSFLTPTTGPIFGQMCENSNLQGSVEKGWWTRPGSNR